MDTVTVMGWPSSGLDVLLDDGDGFLGDDAVDDAVAAQFVLVGVAGGDKDVVRVGLGRIRDVGAARVGLGRGVRVVDDDRQPRRSRPCARHTLSCSPESNR